MTYHQVCEHCGVWQDSHDYEHMARECYPKQIARLENRLRTVIKAATPFRSGEDWGIIKAWLVHDAPTRAQAIQMAQAISLWQRELDDAIEKL